MHKLNDGDFMNITFDYIDDTKNTCWCAYSLVTWSKDDSVYEGTHIACQRAYEMTGMIRSKYLHFQRQGTEDSKINSGDNGNTTKITGYGQNMFKKYSTDLPQLGLRTSSGNLEREAYYEMPSCVNVNDSNFPLIENKMFTGSDLASILISPYDDLVHSCNHSKVKWKFGNNFLFTLF